MNKIVNKFVSLTEYYRILFELIKEIKHIKKSYVFFFLFLLVFSALSEISLLGFLFVLIKAFMDQIITKEISYLSFFGYF